MDTINRRFGHRHADGGLYSYQGPMVGKHPTTGDWVDGVCYLGEDLKPRWTTKERWDDRFTEVPVQDVMEHRTVIRDEEENETIAEFTFRLEDAGDIRHMLISAANCAGKGARDSEHWMKMVLLAQADMVTKNLHIRDHDFPDLLGDVNAFHAKFGLEYLGKVRLLPEDLHDFRTKFHEEETSEYKDEYPKLLDGIERKDRRDIISSLEKQLDGLCDAVWVLLGTADLQFGRKAFFEAWKRVATANMKKIKKIVEEDQQHEDSGREPKYDVVKPAGWVAPDHRDLVQDNAIFDELFGEAPAEDAEFNGTAQEG